MMIFLDTADKEEVKTLLKTGLVDGITTNPSLLKASPMKESSGSVWNRGYLEALCDLLEDRPISLEVECEDEETMVSQGKMLSQISSNVVVKVPLTEAGLRACQRLRAENINVNVTLCFSLSQAILAGKAGANYLSPFIGRLEDVGGDGIALLEDIHEYYTQSGCETKILVASVRNLDHVRDVALSGADIVTVPPKIFRAMFAHPLTEKGLEIFANDSKNLT